VVDKQNKQDWTLVLYNIKIKILYTIVLKYGVKLFLILKCKILTNWSLYSEKCWKMSYFNNFTIGSAGLGLRIDDSILVWITSMNSAATTECARCALYIGPKPI